MRICFLFRRLFFSCDCNLRSVIVEVEFVLVVQFTRNAGIIKKASRHLKKANYHVDIENDGKHTKKSWEMRGQPERDKDLIDAQSVETSRVPDNNIVNIMSLLKTKNIARCPAHSFLLHLVGSGLVLKLFVKCQINLYSVWQSVESRLIFFLLLFHVSKTRWSRWIFSSFIYILSRWQSGGEFHELKPFYWFVYNIEVNF